MRVVLDTNVLVATRRSAQGASHAVLRLVETGTLIPLMTIAVFLEYEAVLKREAQERAHGLNETQIDAVLADLAALAQPVEVHFRWRPQLPDRQDELMLDAAVNGRADALLTHNLRDFLPISRRFGIRVLRPADVLELLRS